MLTKQSKTHTAEKKWVFFINKFAYLNYLTKPKLKENKLLFLRYSFISCSPQFHPDGPENFISRSYCVGMLTIPGTTQKHTKFHQNLSRRFQVTLCNFYFLFMFVYIEYETKCLLQKARNTHFSRTTHLRMRTARAQCIRLE